MENDNTLEKKELWTAKGSTPIVTFSDLTHFKQCAREWQHALFLDHWIISVGYHDIDEYPGENGHVEFDVENQTARITLLKDIPNDRIFKECNELTLVHELLHLKIGFLEAPNSAEGMLWEVHHHRLIYQLSKSLICAKYNLDYEWFKNHDSVL